MFLVIRNSILFLFLVFGIAINTSIASELEVSSNTIIEPNRHHVFIEAGGNGWIYSLNYEYQFQKPFVVRIGYSGFGLIERETRRKLNSHMLVATSSYLFGKKSHYFELGGGVAAGIWASSLNSGDGTKYFLPVSASLLAGYRFQSIGHPLVYRLVLTPQYGGRRFNPLGAAFQIWGGFSLGYQF